MYLFSSRSIVINPKKIIISYRSFRKNIKCIKLTCCWMVFPEYLFQLTMAIVAVTPHSGSKSANSYGRLLVMPSFSMRERKVFGFMSSKAAAPLAPEMTQPVSSSVRRM